MSATTLWKCEVCGYVHEGPEPPAECPVCGVGPDQFSKLEVSLGETSAAPAAAPEAWRCTVCDHVHEGPEPPAQCPVCGAPASMFEPEAPPPAVAPSKAGGRVVIVGAGVAAITAAEHARRTAPQAEITVLSKEPGRPYLRLNLTRLLAGEVQEADLALQPEGWYADHHISLREGEVEAVDPAATRVTLRGGETLEYDALVLANGAHPFVPPITGATREGVFTFRTVEDARAIGERVRSGTRCVCIGGGLLGLETAGALQRRGVSVSVVEGFGWLLPRQLPQPAGQRLQAHLERLGIAVRCGATVKEIRGDEAVAEVLLADGETLPADAVIISAGVRPNSWLARRCGLTVERGVVVDDRMATSAPQVFAAGDVAEHRGAVFGIWPTAYAQGMVAGINAAGGQARYPGMAPSNRLKVLDVDLFSIGRIEAEDASTEIWERETDDRYARILLHDGRIVGAALYGDTSLAGRLKDAIDSGVQVRESDLAGELAGFERR